MTSATTLYPQVTDYLVAACQASGQLGQAVPVPVTIHDGPEIDGDTLVQPRHLWIGAQPAAMRSGEPGASGTQQFSFVGDQAVTRDETYEITCTADSWGGSAVLKTYRDDCAAIIDGMSLLFRGRPQTGGPGDFSLGGLVFWAQVAGPLEWIPRQTQDGAGMLCVFRIQYQGRTAT